MPGNEARFAAVVSRAAFSLQRFLELAAPLLLPGGLAIALKGPELPALDVQAAQQRRPGCSWKAWSLGNFASLLPGRPACWSWSEKKSELRQLSKAP